MRLLVTGGMGFIGSNFIRYMLRKYPDAEIVNLDKMTYAANPANCRDFEKDGRYSLVKGDICDEKLCAKLASECDAIVNFAAESHVDRSIEDAGEFVRSNIYGVYSLLEAARKKGVAKFLHISTDEVYGSRMEGSFVERDKFEPSSPYAASKASAELLCRSYFVTHALPILITRSSNNYGPGQHPEKFIPRCVSRLKDGKKIEIYGSGKQVRDWLYVMDNCSGIDAVLQKGKSGEAYNISANCERTNLEVARAILRIMKKDDGMISYTEDRKGHDFRYSIDAGKVRKLGWKPSADFGKTLAGYMKTEFGV